VLMGTCVFMRMLMFTVFVTLHFSSPSSYNVLL
jgi:hypothetical protein